MENEVSAVIHASRNGPNDREHAEQKLKEAGAIEQSLDPPSGPAEPIKPSFELLGEVLLEQGRNKDAAAAFEQALTRMPNRRASLQGLERAQSTRTSQAR